MTSRPIDRRTFLSAGAKAGFTVCGLCICSNFDNFVFAGEEIDPSQLNYCGYTCPEDCKFLQGTLNDDVELKKEAWKLWKIEERFGFEFDPEQAICYGCKTLDQPEGIVLARCTVRSCAQEKKINSCIECDELKDCDKDLWARFPKFKEQVILMQKNYRAQA